MFFWQINEWSIDCLLIRYLLEFIFSFFVVAFFQKEKFRDVFDKIFNNRYKIGIALILFCVLFEINGSSIGVYGNYLSTEDEDLIFGIPRTIRSDEYAVFTPMAISQKYNDYGYFSDIFRGEKTDMYIEYGQPVKDIAVLFRPFQIGYLFLGTAKGLSFFWSARLVALFLVTMQLGLLISDGKRHLAFLMAVLVTFAPVTQWWFAINGLVEMLVFGQLMALSFEKIIKHKKNQFVNVALFFWSAGCYLFAMYPAWEVPLVYIFGCIIIGILLNNWGEFHFDRTDIVALATNGICFICLTAYIFLKSSDAILAITATSYPGGRVELGGNGFLRFFQSIGTIFLGSINDWFFNVSQNGIISNPCQEAVFIDLFPLGTIFAIREVLCKKKKDFILIMALLGELFLGLYCIVGFPEWLAKISLLSMCPVTRVTSIIGFLNIVLLVRSLRNNDWKIKNSYCIMFSAIYTIMILVANEQVYGIFLSMIKKMILVAVVFSLSYFLLQYNSGIKMKRRFMFLTCGIVIASGIIVNPIQKGISVVSKNALLGKIESIVEQDKSALWLVNDSNFAINNLPTMAGAKTVNSTNVYPDMKKWEKIDPEAKNKEIYNRYAHITIILQKDQMTNFYLTADDAFTVMLNVEDLRKFNVSYILSKTNLNELSDNKVGFKEIAKENGYTIYKVYD